MAGTSDKARFYLEQSVPELHELLKKSLFTKQEITSIAKTRSDFEHKLNARGSRPVDYARYAEYEMNLDALRRKRTKRKGLKSGGHAGQRRIFFVLDRATKRFSGDTGLWMQYIDFARKQKANKKMSQILTTVLRLHPTNPELWIYAANYALDEKSDMTEARSYPNETDSEEFEYIDKDILEKLQETPALSGAIPIAIFDAAMKQFSCDSDLGKTLFETVALFQGIPEPTSCVKIFSGDFPAAVRGSLDRLKVSLAALSELSNAQIIARSRSSLARETIHWALGLLVHQDLDQDITKVLLAVVKKTWNQLLIDLEKKE
ncbi:hypothetical protein G7Y79_00003g008820 [Physcia stellaris]|nr:hypothetical protein G7Y79_00003g008820 [Physcia stellaris]